MRVDHLYDIFVTDEIGAAKNIGDQYQESSCRFARKTLSSISWTFWTVERSAECRMPRRPRRERTLYDEDISKSSIHVF